MTEKLDNLLASEDTIIATANFANINYLITIFREGDSWRLNIYNETESDPQDYSDKKNVYEINNQLKVTIDGEDRGFDPTTLRWTAEEPPKEV